ALEALPNPPADVEMVHFLTNGAIPHDVAGKPTTKYRHRCFFVGSDVRAAIKLGIAEYLPISIARVPELFNIGRIRLDVAIIQVSMPDRFGYMSLGVSVDIVAAAVQNAKLVIAEVNPHMPWTMGDSAIHHSQIHRLVKVDSPMIEYVHQVTEEDVVEQIARYIASTIEDGSTLQIGLGRIPNEALKYLEDRKDLGIHSDVITDAIIPLLEKGILTGKQKTQQKGKIVTSLALGTRQLYDILDRNPLFSFQPMEVVCNPITIASQRKMVSVTQAFAVDLTGQVCSDQFEGEFYSGIAAQGEFLRGASRSPGGKPIICLASTTDDGETSRIRPLLLAGEGVTVARADVHYVITEYGIAYLFGKPMRERAIALIQLAHPKFRQQLLEDAKKLGYLATDQTLKSMRAYPVEEERVVHLKNNVAVMLRPARASDADSIRELFFKLPADDIYTRFFRRVQKLSNKDIQRLCNFSYDNEVGFVAVTGPREQEVMVGQSCYFINLTTNLAETAFLVDPAWQGTGLGSAMQQRMVEHAKARGLRGFVAEILPENTKMIALARKGSTQVSVERDEETVHVTMLF
ncbi:MAG: GNAT family N-acetyltransferase, partial [Rhodoferax sp.]|nr:GNAT family N-acetyltransferase [Rhodoferax sp.]